MFRSLHLFAALFLFTAPAFARPGPNLSEGRAFQATENLVGLYVFHWYTPTTGQTKSVWKPVEGRLNWDGSVDFWRAEIKDMMAANPDYLLVHLIDHHEPQRVNLFEALSQLRAEGYQTPPVVPFLDPAITFFGPPDHMRHLDFAHTADRRLFLDQFLRFYQQYATASTDPEALSYLGTMDGKPMLNIWGVGPPQINNKDLLTREFAESSLEQEGGDFFASGVFWSSIIPQDGFTWSDEYNRSFVGYTGDYILFDRNVASLKPGHYDTLDRFLARDNGNGYVNAWNRARGKDGVNRVLIESWNEYTEGTGLYEVANLEPDTTDPAYAPHADRWADDPRFYIRTTAQQASQFNSMPERDAVFLGHDLPDQMQAGSRHVIRVLVRNAGDLSWRGRDGFQLRQTDDVLPRLVAAPVVIDDATHEIPTYGGIFRGRPVEFRFSITAPDVNGRRETAWRMHQGDQAFGETLTHTIEIVGGKEPAGSAWRVK